MSGHNLNGSTHRSRIPAGAVDHLYLAELVLQAEFALLAYGEIVQRASGGDLSLFAFIQLMLGSSANVSKLLFPTDRASAETRERCRRLRTKLSLDDTSPLAERTARNYVDHFDERLDEYIGRTKGVMIHRLIAQEAAAPTIRLDDGSEHPATYLQLFEVPSLTLVLHGQRIELRALAETILAVQRAAVDAEPLAVLPGWKLTCFDTPP